MATNKGPHGDMESKGNDELFMAAEGAFDDVLENSHLQPKKTRKKFDKYDEDEASRTADDTGSMIQNNMNDEK